MSRKSDKVYCRDCEHHSSLVGHCAHPSFTKLVDGPLAPCLIFGNCVRINKSNNCKYFKQEIYEKEKISLLTKMFRRLLCVN